MSGNFIRFTALSQSTGESKMALTLRKVGEWNIAERVLNSLSKNLYPEFKAYVDTAGQLYLDKVLSHIDSQDLGWTPLSEHTIAVKGGSSTILVETGFLRGGIQAISVSSSDTAYSIFVGAMQGINHPSGMPLSDLMMWIEYGTDRMPARPLIRPSWDEVKDQVTKEALKLLQNSVMSGRG